MSQTTPLSLEQEQQAVDAITAPGWTDSHEAGRHAVVGVLAITDQQAARRRTYREDLTSGMLSSSRFHRFPLILRLPTDSGALPWQSNRFGDG